MPLGSNRIAQSGLIHGIVNYDSFGIGTPDSRRGAHAGHATPPPLSFLTIGMNAPYTNEISALEQEMLDSSEQICSLQAICHTDLKTELKAVKSPASTTAA